MSDRSTSRSKRSAGFSLIEGLVGLVMVGVVVLLLAPALLQVANDRVLVEAATDRETVLQGEADRLSSLPFVDLDAEAGCALFSDPFAHTKCIVITQVSIQERELKVRVVPANTAVARDSIVLTRTNRRANPFNTAQP
jgi:type II secretory pathway pseudopilin PulG